MWWLPIAFFGAGIASTYNNDRDEYFWSGSGDLIRGRGRNPRDREYVFSGHLLKRLDRDDPDRVIVAVKEYYETFHKPILTEQDVDQMVKWWNKHIKSEEDNE